MNPNETNEFLGYAKQLEEATIEELVIAMTLAPTEWEVSAIGNELQRRTEETGAIEK